MIKQVCPRCKQDYIHKVKIIPLSKFVFLCAECDALWEMEMPVTQKNYTDFGNYMKGYGYSGDWSLIEKYNSDNINSEEDYKSP
ncbi:MAG: hypothetical protein QNJ45_26130 [Ardenticatenaceae bacterium]|nr:hypothetical protein [Ardenticatenaceae bacterium]